MHWFSGASYAGSQDGTVGAPMGPPPVFVRVGAVIPMGPADLDTLIEADPPLVSPSQRPYLRAWILPGVREDVPTEEGPRLIAERTSSGIDLSVDVGAPRVSDVRMQTHLANADPPLSAVASVTIDGGPVLATDVATVQS